MHRTFIILFLAQVVITCTVDAQSLNELDDKLVLSSSDDERKNILLSLDTDFLRAQRENSLPYLDTLIRIGMLQDDRLAIATGLVNKGNVLYYMGDIKESSALYYNALEYADDASGYDALRVRILNNLGWNFKKLEDNQRALSLMRDAVRLGDLVGNDTLMGGVLNNLAVVQKDLKDYAGALVTLGQSIQINRRLDQEQQVRYNLNNMGVVLTHLRKFEDARDTLRKVLVMNYAQADTSEISNNLLNLGIVYYNLGKIDSANQYLESALLIVSDDMLRRRIYFAFDQVMVSKQDYKNALNFSHKFYLLTDSLNNLRRHEYVLELDSKYESLIQQRDLEKAQANLANQRNLMYVILGALLIFIALAIFLIYLIRIKHRNETSLREVNEKFIQQAEKLTESNRKIREINENLEGIVKQRTATLQKQNERLLHFTFLNSHRIRGPIASLLGLIYLLKDEKNGGIEDELRNHLHKTALSLDMMVREVTKKLEEEELDE